MTKNKQWIYAKAFEGEPKTTDFEFQEKDTQPLKDGEVLFEALYLSVDPYMRAVVPRMIPPGQTMFGGQVARVVESRHKDYEVGSNVMGMFGWQLFTVCSPDTFKTPFGGVQPLPDFGDLPASVALGVLGMPGFTAYFGFLDICQPKEGEVVVVSGAAGAVGNIVGQIAKIKGCRVIGIAGSDDKIDWLIDELKFDGGINYKTQTISKELKKLAPKGVDCYFDNVGGEISSIVLDQMNGQGRIAVCGSVSLYNTKPGTKVQAPAVQPAFVANRLKMEGFQVTQFQSRWTKGLEQLLQWITEGKLKYRETITEGFMKMPEAFIGLLKGENAGKAIVKV